MKTKRKHRRSPSLFEAAVFSPCRKYRYALTREWANRSPTILFVGLNPSTADELTDDATVRRCVGFAKRLGYSRLLLANLFAFRATDPGVLTTADDPVGPENDNWIIEASNAADLTVVAWGIHGSLLGRSAAVLSSLQSPHCLGTTKYGFPRHPLYLPADALLEEFHA